MGFSEPRSDKKLIELKECYGREFRSEVKVNLVISFKVRNEKTNQ